MAEEFDRQTGEEQPLEELAAQPEPEEGPEPTRAEPEETKENQAAKRPGTELYEWLQMVMGCVLAAVLMFNCVARLTRVDGDSMDKTLRDGEMLLIWSLGYQPRQGDIVVLNKTTAEFLGGEGGKAIVKRIIATGGQTVDIDYGTSTVYVDGQPLEEPYLWEPMYAYGDPMMHGTHWEVPEHSIFVMGDNRNGSTDSRHQLLGCIDQDYILGKVVLALWPPERFGLM